VKQKQVPTHPIDGEYIREWLVLGPFFPDDLEIDFLADVGGEADASPREGDPVTTEDGRTLAWQRCKSTTDIVHICDYIGRHQNATAYAFCILQGEIAGDVEICLASDVDVTLWVNQKSFNHSAAYHHHDALDQCTFHVESQEGANRCLIRFYSESPDWSFAWLFAARVLPPHRGIISGTVTDEQGRSVPNAIVRLQQNGEEITRTRSDDSGSYHLGVYPVHGSYELSANSVVRRTRESPYADMLGDLSDSRSDIRLCEDERQEIHFTLRKVISIEGTLLMLDGITPHAGIPVQAVMIDNDYPTERLIATRFSDERGQYQFANLKPGSYRVRCQVPGGYIYYGTEQGEKPEKLEAGGLENGTGQSRRLLVESETTFSNINFRFAPFKKGTWRNYTYSDGLAGNSVFAVHGDPDGALWFGTLDSGVSRYDGKEFTNFTREDGLPSNGVLAIYREPDGTMWFGTRKGVSRYDGKEFINFGKEDGLVSNIVNDIYCEPNGNMWFAAGNPIGEGIGGISCYDGKEFTHFSIDDGLSKSVFAIYHAPDGVMWFGTFGGLFRYDGKEFVKFTLSDEWKRDFVFCIHRAPDGALWFGTLANGVYRYDGREIVNYTIADGLANNTVTTINTDSNGFMWFGTGSLWGVVGNGVSRYDGKTFVTFTTEDGLVNNTVRAIYSDPDGALWFGTDGGVSRYHSKEFVNLTTRDGLAGNAVKSIYSDPDNTLWIGTNGGVSRYSGGAFTNLTEEDGLISNSVEFVLRAPDGNLWFGTRWNGISRYDDRGMGDCPHFTNFTTGDTMLDQVSAGHSDPDGTLWFGTRGGLSRYDGVEFTTFTSKDGLLNNWVYAIYRDPDGILWVGTRDGISRYDGTEFASLTEEDGLPHAHVSAIYRAPDGMMWFGTNGGGVSRYDGETFTNFTTRDGLTHNSVATIYRDHDGTLWFGTWGGGISRYDGIAWTSLDTRDGLADNYVESIHQDEEGFLWFGTGKGITRYHPGTTSPGVYIASVITDQTYRDLSAIPAFTPGTRVTIEYGSIDFRTIPGKRQYRYRIYETSDLRHETSDSSLKSQVSSLPYNSPTKETSFDWIPEEPGTYIFQVQAIDRDLNYSEPATVNLTIEPDPVLVSMQAELNYLRSEAGRKYQFESIIGRSAAIMEVRALMEKAIESRLAVLITGETGTGKELVAKAIHHNSPRKDRPLLAMNCGAIPRELLASELFGHRRGAFTGAREDKIGLFEAASGGTVILDEISEMPENAQVHLLRVLEERVVQRLGEHISRDVDVRVIAIANKDLMKEVSEGRFREDLYYRLSVFPIYVPPLRERIEDISPLAEHFLQDVEKELDGFAPDVFQALQSYSWPGNVRELRNAVHRAAALAEERIQTYHFPPEITRGESLIQDAIASQSGYSETVKSFQRRFIEQVLRECQGNRHEAARRLKMHRPNLLRLMKKLGIS
jgi:DNA-binding NtrC family response regulator/ligand-binding sensor domain-containing protein